MAANLVRDYGFLHLSTGDLLREEVQRGGELADKLNALMKEGKLVSSDLVVELLKKAVEKGGKQRYLFDGFPRNQENWDQFRSQINQD